MNLLISTAQTDAADRAAGKTVALEDLILTTALPTTGGSKMLDGYMSLFDAEAVNRLAAAGYGIAGKANVGEFGFDLLGETSYFGACADEAGNLAAASSLLLASNAAEAVIGLDVNGAQRRAAAQSGQVCVKPTYGTVSRFGTIAIACSGETVCVTANTAAKAQEVLAAIAGHDDKDGTSLPEECCELVKGSPRELAHKKIAVAKGLVEGADAAVKSCIDAFVAFAQGAGFVVEEVDDAVLRAARPAWNVCLCAELCNNVSRFDGVKYGYRSANAATIDDLYTNSRTEAFGEVLKTAILYGSEMLSEENYDKMYDRSLRIRRVVCEEFARLFESYDAVLTPAASKAAFTPADAEADKFLCFKENECTAPASLTGLPAVVAGGVQLVGPAFSDAALLQLAERFDAAAKTPATCAAGDDSEEVR
ncbi:MAG: hypothetical protein IJC51_02945 [Eggerthellaceae bacterium]|nr:hypothetical protein [Eggerthellaceae bacterium]